MNFFFDRNIGVRLARMLDSFDPKNQVRHLDDDARFPENIPDIDFIEVLAEDRPKPVLITADTSMYKKNPAERKALVNSGLTIVFLRKGFHNLPFHTQAWKLLRRWPDIVRETSRCREPTVFEIAPSFRKVQRIGPTKEL